ncbi:MAG: glucose-1-phosphate thymidylyltransferase [Nanoarchaeota archaeon]
MIIGIRAYLTEASHDELVFQLEEARKHFPQAAIVVALCGQRPTERIAGLGATIIHYSETLIGLTEAWKILVKEAQQAKDSLIVVDGDDQHLFSEIRRMLDENKGEKAIIPEREKRVVFLSDSQLSRSTLEDLENGFIRMRYPQCPPDPQPGLYLLLDPDVVGKLDFETVGPFVGDLALLDQLLSQGIAIKAPLIKVRPQTSTTLNLEISFHLVNDAERYFSVRFLDLIDAFKKNPAQFMQQSRLQDIEAIRRWYKGMLDRQQVTRMKGLILAGGFGERLRPITHTTQKQVIPIANKPILYYVIEDLVEIGIRDIAIIVGPNREQVKAVVGDGSRWNARITYLHQEKPLGLAHAVLLAEDYLGDEDFIMYLGDNMLDGTLADFAVRFKGSGADASILLTPVKDPQRFGIAKLNNLGEVERILEKPKDPPSNLAIIGIYAFKHVIFDACKAIKPSARGELEITDAMQWLLSHKHKIIADLVQGWWKDTGKPDALLEVNRLVLDSRMIYTNEAQIAPEATVIGRVGIGHGSRVIGKSLVRGPIIIGSNCTIGPDALIGPYTSIGDKVTIERAEVDHSIILSNTIIRSHNRIVDSIIGQGVRITPSAETLPRGNRLILGDNAEIEL